MPNLVSGSVSFTATLQNQEENPTLDMTAELYFLGNKVDPSSYKAEYDGSNKKLTVSPIALSSGGTYVVKVIAMSTSSGTAYTVSNNFIIEIDGYIRKTLDVSDPYFINDEKKVHLNLERANVVGALTTQAKGAIGVAPSKEEIQKFLDLRHN